MGDSADVTARVYHTEHGNEHLEGETYSVDDEALLETLRGIGFVTIEGWTPVAPPAAPVLATLTPATCVVGAAAFTLRVQGSGFTATDVVNVNGAPVATTFVSANELTTPIASPVSAAAIPVTVQGAGGVSNALTFTVTASR
jgi:IPT/TIG domain